MKILLVDGTNVVMRYAAAMLPDLMSTGARAPEQPEIEKVLAAVEHSVRRCAEVAGCTHAVICLDSNVDPWRKAVFPEYKQNRTRVTTEWTGRLHFYFTARGWLTLRYPGQEADDIIATLATRARERQKACAVLSGDSDLLALIDEGIEVYQYGRDKEPRYVRRTEDFVFQKYGVMPNRLRLYKALVGEPGDGIPGVRGVGVKKAAKILDLAGYEHTGVRVLLQNHSGSAVGEFDQMLAVVSLNTKVPLDPIAPARCIIPTEQ